MSIKQNKIYVTNSIKLTIACLIILCLWAALHLIFSYHEGTRRPSHKADAAVILGNEVKSDGTLSKRLKERVNRGLELYNEHMVDKIIVSGGLGKSGYYEGDSMKQYLLSQGVPEQDIIVDNLGSNTRNTAKNTAAIKTKYGINSIIVVSQYYHISRAKMLFYKYGFKDVQSASPKYMELYDLYSIPREFIAYYVDKFIRN